MSPSQCTVFLCDKKPAEFPAVSVDSSIICCEGYGVPLFCSHLFYLAL